MNKEQIEAMAKDILASIESLYYQTSDRVDEIMKQLSSTQAMENQPKSNRGRGGGKRRITNKLIEEVIHELTENWLKTIKRLALISPRLSLPSWGQA